jgi:hypothetical protein
MNMNKCIAFCVALGLGLVPYPALAGRYDGSVPLLCAVIEVIECDVGVECHRGSAESVNLPQFIKINFTDKTLSTTEEAQTHKTTPINNIEQFDSSMILQGVEGSRAWSVVIAKDTGKISAALAKDSCFSRSRRSHSPAGPLGE